MERNITEVKKQTVVVFVDSSSISFYMKDTGNILQLDVPLDIVSDLEVIARDKLEQLIDAFFQANNLKSFELDAIIVFSQNVTFERDFTEELLKTKHEDSQKFLDIVPFENVLSKTYKIDKKTKVVALNKALYDAIYLSLERNKVRVFLVIPMVVLAETNPELSSNIDLGFVATRADSFKQYSLVDIKTKDLEGEQKNAVGIKKKDVRLYVLIGIFALLFIILLVLVFNMFSSSKTTAKTTVLQKTPTTTKVVTTTTLKEIVPSASTSGNIQPTNFPTPINH
jgi:hypothetical protein